MSAQNSTIQTGGENVAVPTVQSRENDTNGSIANQRREALIVVRDSQISSHLDFVRGFAAVAVFVGHARNLFFVDYRELREPSLLTMAMYTLTGNAHSWVIVFFVLSGYFISASIRRDVDRGDWSWRKYMINRLARLYVVLLPALLLTWVLDRLGIYLTDSGIYRGLGGQLVVRDVLPSLNWQTFAGNLLYLQNYYVPVFGSDGPLWSLSHEFWYYLLFPLAVQLTRRQCAMQLAVTVAAFLAIAFISFPLIQYLPIWLLGAGIAYSNRAPWLRSPVVHRVAMPLTAVGFVIALTMVRFQKLSSPYLSDGAVGVAFAACVLVLLNHPSRRSSGLYAKAASGLAGMSYTLYLVHVPILAFIASLFGASQRWTPTFGSAAVFGVILTAVFLVASLIAALTERNTDVVRNALNRCFPLESSKTF